MATAEKLGRFDYHPDPAIDFCLEVESIDGQVYDVSVGMADSVTVQKRIACAMEFNVGGDEIAVNAKRFLRKCADKLGMYDRSPPHANRS